MANKMEFTGTYWTITDGTWYVSFLGSDDSGDGSPAKPFATIAHAVSVADSGDKIVIGTGQYSESVDGDEKDCVIYGDGYVELNGAGTAFFNMGSAAELHNITSISGYTYAVNGMYILSNCFINACNVIGEIAYVQNCVLRGLSFYPNTTTVFTELKNSIFLAVYSTDAMQLGRIENCYFDPNGDFGFSTSHLLYFDFCAIDISGALVIDGSHYADSASVHADYPAYQEHGTDVSDPGFNDTSRYDYTLSPSSPLRYTGSDGRFIGAHGVETLLSYDTLVSPSLTNVTVNDDDNYTVTLEGEIATLLTGSIDLGERRQLGKANLYASMFFMNNDEPNFSVDDSPLHTTPDVLTFSLRFSDNPNRLARVKYNTYRWEELITNDATGRGNGDPVFNSLTAKPVEARYIQLKITMSDTSFYLLQQNSGKIDQEDSTGKLLHNNV